MVKIGSISVGKKEKRSFFNLTHDVNTTSDFGFCQPTLIRHFIKGTKINLKSNTFVRLAPLPVPTFGRVQCQQHTAFVPMTDVFEAFDYLQSNKSVSSALRSYVPVSTDFCSNQFLLSSLFTLFFSVSKFYVPLSLDGPDAWLSRLPFRISINLQVAYFRTDIQQKLINLGFKATDYFDILNDVRIYNNDNVEQSLINDLTKLALVIIADNSDPLLVDYLNNYFYNTSEGFDENITGIHNISFDTGSRVFSQKVPLLAFSWVHSRKLASLSGFNRTMYNDSDLLSLTGQDFNVFSSYDSRFSYIYDPIDYHSADYIFKSFFSLDYDVYSNQGQVAFGVHLTPQGKRILKVFNASRIHFGRKKDVSLDKLYAYYKVWFDKYNAGRNIQWRDTNCYKLIHSFYDTGIPTEKVFRQGLVLDYDFLNETIVSNLRLNWLNFLLDIPNCVYCSPLDNITVATDSPILENTMQTHSNPLYDVPGFAGSNTIEVPYTKDNSIQALTDDTAPYYQIYGNQTGISVRLMQTLYKLVNKNSVLGSKVDEYLRAHGIANGLPKTKILGDNKFMCTLDEVFATVNNEASLLGEYAGKGVGSGQSETMHFETDSFGYLIQLTLLVPLGGYVQGDSSEYISRYDFYQSEFDSLGMEVLPQSGVIGQSNYFLSRPIDDSVFGFVPRYFNLKIENNLQNGGFVFNSESASFLPYSLDKIISNPSVDDFMRFDKVIGDLPCDEELRYIGRKEFYGNFDRIFYDTTGKTDNFIIHIVQDLSMYAPMKPIDNSFETYDEFNDDSVQKVEHA